MHSIGVMTAGIRVHDLCATWFDLWIGRNSDVQPLLKLWIPSTCFSTHSAYPSIACRVSPHLGSGLAHQA